MSYIYFKVVNQEPFKKCNHFIPKMALAHYISPVKRNYASYAACLKAFDKALQRQLAKMLQPEVDSYTYFLWFYHQQQEAFERLGSTELLLNRPEVRER